MASLASAVASTSRVRLPALIVARTASVRSSVLVPVPLFPVQCRPFRSGVPWSTSQVTAAPIAYQSDLSSEVADGGQGDNDAVAMVNEEGSAADPLLEQLDVTEKPRRPRNNVALQSVHALIQTLLAADHPDFQRMAPNRVKERIRAVRPYLSDTEANLIATLKSLLQISGRMGVRITPRELFDIHRALVRGTRDIWKEMLPASTAPHEDRLPAIPSCHVSMDSYKMLLRYAFNVRDEQTLRAIGHDALLWLDANKRARSRGAHLLRDLREKMNEDAEASKIRTMIRTLLLSSTARRAFGQNSRQSDHDRWENLDLRQHDQTSPFQLHNDVHLLTRILRTRFGAMRRKPGPSNIDQTGALSNGEAVAEEALYGVSTAAVEAPHPLLKQSRRDRQLNTELQRLVLRANQDPLTGLVDSAAQSKPDHTIQLVREINVTFPILDLSRDAADKRAKENASKAGDGQDQIVPRSKEDETQEWIANQLDRWTNDIQEWQARRLRLGEDLIKVASLSSHPAIPDDSTAIDATAGQGAPLLPTWLLSSALQAHVEACQPERADRIVQLYLQALARSKGIEESRLVHILPIDRRIYAITRPSEPPNSTSLLNAMLRSHATAGAREAFDNMLFTMERWCVGGSGLAKRVRQAYPLRGEARWRFRPAYFAQHPVHAPCLHPNENTLLILLAALRNQGHREELAMALLEECVARWSTTPWQRVFVSPGSDAVKDLPLVDGKQHCLRLTTRTLRNILQYAINSKSTPLILDLFNRYETWIEDIRYGDPTDFDPRLRMDKRYPAVPSLWWVLYHRDTRYAREERDKWMRTVERAAKKDLVSQERIDEILALDRA